ncbi:MAG: TonB-dependent receptor [Pseudomonadota bacterium]
MYKSRLSQLLASCAAYALLSAPVAHAQEAERDVEDIMVTAQKREQAIKDVPLTITALTGEFLRKLDATEFDEVALFTPGLTIQEQSPNNPGFVIRGITSDSGNAQQAPRVSVYYNGVDVSRSRGSFFDLFDIERVEVVKGPQSTLFGTAAAIGAVSVISNKAEEGFSAEGSFAYGNYDYIESQGFVNYGTDVIAGRIAWSYKDREGFIDNVFSGPGSLPDGQFGQSLNGQNVLAFRGTLSFTPTTDFRADLVLSFDRQRPPGTSFKSGTFAPPGGDTSPFTFASLSGAPDSEETLLGEEPGLDREVIDLNLTMSYDFNEQWKITSISGYREFDSVEVFDADGSAAPYLEFTEDSIGDQWSQEIRMNYDGEGWSTFFGGSYFHEDGSQTVPFSTEEGLLLECLTGALELGCVAPDGSVPALNATAALTGGALTSIPYSQILGNTGSFDIWTLYADATVEVTDRLEISLGGRYVNESRTSGVFNEAPASQLAPQLIAAGTALDDPGLLGLGAFLDGFLPLGTANTDGQILTDSADFSDWLMRANILYRITDDISVYATTGRGRRSDVLNVTAGNTRQTPAGPVTIPPFAQTELIPAEIIWNYEAGIKGNFFDGRMFASAAVFYQDYKNFQVTIPQLDAEGQPTGQFITSGAGGATNFGVEAEFSANVTEELQVFGNAAYIDAQIDDDPDVNGDLAGNRFRLQPKWAASAGALYEREITDDLSGFVTLTWTFEGSKFFEQPNDPIIAEDAYSLVNLRVGVKDPDGRWQVDAFATNLFDKQYVIDAGNTGGAFGIPTFIAGAPRFYGIRISGAL